MESQNTDSEFSVVPELFIRRVIRMGRFDRWCDKCGNPFENGMSDAYYNRKLSIMAGHILSS